MWASSGAVDILTTVRHDWDGTNAIAPVLAATVALERIDARVIAMSVMCDNNSILLAGFCG